MAFVGSAAGVAALAGLAISAGTSIYGIAHSAHKENKAEKALAKLQANRPTYEVDPIIRNQASQGVPSATANQYFGAIDRDTGASIDAINRGGGDLNLISQLKGQNNNQYLKFLAIDAEARFKNQQALVAENRQAWDYNNNIPYQQKYNQYGQQINSAQLNQKMYTDQLANTAISTAGMMSNGGRNEGGGGNDWSNGNWWGNIGQPVNQYNSVNTQLQNQYGIYTG